MSWSQTFEPAGSASRPARSTTPRSSRRSCRLASTPSRATLHTSCAKRSAAHSRRRRSPPEPPAHADAQPLLLTFSEQARGEGRDGRGQAGGPRVRRSGAFVRASRSSGVSVSVGGRPPWSRIRGSTVGQSRPRCGSSRRRGCGCRRGKRTTQTLTHLKGESIHGPARTGRSPPGRLGGRRPHVDADRTARLPAVA